MKERKQAESIKYLSIHQDVPENELSNVWAFREVVVIRSTALGLTLSCTADEFPKQIEFAPMDFARVVNVDIGVAFMSTNKI